MEFVQRKRAKVTQDQDEMPRRSRPSRKLRLKAASKASSVAVKALVNRTINRLTETKTARYNFNGDIAYYNGSIFSSGASIIPISPYTGYLAINQGTGQGDRIGNTIRPYNVKLRFMLQPAGYNATYNPAPQPHVVRMIIFKSKNYGNSTLQTTLPSLFQNGDTAAAPVSSLQDAVFPLNRDLYSIYEDRIIKVGCAASNGTGGAAGYQYLSNNDFELCPRVVIDVTKYLPSRITFNDTSAVSTPNDTALYVTFLACRSDGTTPAAANTLTPLFCWGCVDFQFKDA